MLPGRENETLDEALIQFISKQIIIRLINSDLEKKILNKKDFILEMLLVGEIILNTLQIFLLREKKLHSFMVIRLMEYTNLEMNL